MPRFFRPSLSVCLPAVLLIVTACSDGADLNSPTLHPEFAKAASTLNVSSTIADADASVASTLQIRSDGLGVYRNSSTLTSQIQSVGAWVLDSYNPRNSPRRVMLEFSQPVAGSGPNGGDPIAIPSGAYKTHLIMKCNLYGNSMLTLAPGATIHCPVHFGSIYVGSTEYAVQMNPLNSADPDASYPETNFADVTCVVPSSGTGKCTTWRITPNGTYTAPDGSIQRRNVAKLLKLVSAKGGTTKVDQGDFYMSFSFTVSNP